MWKWEKMKYYNQKLFITNNWKRNIVKIHVVEWICLYFSQTVSHNGIKVITTFLPLFFNNTFSAHNTCAILRAMNTLTPLSIAGKSFSFVFVWCSFSCLCFLATCSSILYTKTHLLDVVNSVVSYKNSIETVMWFRFFFTELLFL